MTTGVQRAVQAAHMSGTVENGSAVDLSRRSGASVTIGHVNPLVEGGRYPIKRVVGEPLPVRATIFGADDPKGLVVSVLWRGLEEGNVTSWSHAPMLKTNEGGHQWEGSISFSSPGVYEYKIRAGFSPFGMFREEALGESGSGDDLTDVHFQMCAKLVEGALGSVSDQDDQQTLALMLSAIKNHEPSVVLGSQLYSMMMRYEEPVSFQEKGSFIAFVDPERAKFSFWYELFPRSATNDPLAADGPPRHGTFEDVRKLLPYVAGLGADILYLPPIHPIGRTSRKGPDGSLVAGPDDPGSPWAIGSENGGHKSIHPQLGTLEDFKKLVGEARKLDIQIAVDLALQASPDHPYVVEHREWFKFRPDGTIQCAENPPKRYEDVCPFDFSTSAKDELWAELKSIVEFWIGQGVNVFRVDNPHTKPPEFWEWLILNIKLKHPEVIFLAEAFAGESVMSHYAMLGFSASYNHFAWKRDKEALKGYFMMLGGLREYLRANLWPNTPDILADPLRNGGWPAFQSRLVLAATLGASYGIYGPEFELGVNTPRGDGSEEYRDSAKFSLRRYDWEKATPIRELLPRLNEIRRENPALREQTMYFHEVYNPKLIGYSKSGEGNNRILTVVNLDVENTQEGRTALNMDALGLKAGAQFYVHDLLTGVRYPWSGHDNYVKLGPGMAHIFRIEE